MEKKPEIPEYIIELVKKGEADEIRLDADGNWFHNGSPFRNKKIIRFFNQSIDITADGTFVISYPGYVYPVIIEDTPVFITAILCENKGTVNETIQIALSSGGSEILDINTIYLKNNALYCKVKNEKFDAKFKRSPSYELLSRIEENEDVYFLNICGKKIIVSEKTDDE